MSPSGTDGSLDDARTIPAGVKAGTASTDGQTSPTADSGPLRAGQAFGGRYHIIRVLGVGGMGAVYQAWDAELGEAVAIKVIRPEGMGSPGAAFELEKRFKRELLLARQVTHKNVVRIHDLGEIDGIKYITMSYVEGTDLATLLKREGALSVPRALSITRGIVEGLIAAHKAGVVHRDLKPGNIMVSAGDGEALIMDFGIARSTGSPASSSTQSVIAGLPADLRHAARSMEATMASSVAGTVQYMAPEQARGEDVDQRADIYALGLILYDLLSGRHRAKHADSALSELRSRMEQAPPAIKSLVPEVPDALAQLVSRCLEPETAKRYQTTQELADALARLDQHGVPIPVRRTVGLPMMTAIVVLLLALSTAGWWMLRPPPPPVEHDPVSVVVADVQNGTGDPSFDGTLEPMIRRALEGASFISAYDRTGVRILGVSPPDSLDESAARELAVNQGVGVVLSTAIEPRGSSYEISLTAVETVTGNVIAEVQRQASSKDQVLEVAANLVATVRRALGEEASESAQMFAMASLSATSLDVVGHYAAAQEAASRGQFGEAIQDALEAVALDPEFGVGYQLLAAYSRNLGRVQDARKYIDEALRYLDGMTERERYGTRGFFYRMTGDYQQCVNEYGELIARYAADVVGHNQRALCLSKLRDMRGAVDGMRRVVDLLPNQVIFRDNLALYASYAGDFQMAEQEVLTMQDPDAYGRLALAFAQLGQGQFTQAGNTYQELADLGSPGASFAASGLGDLATLEGRFSDAARIFEEGVTAELASSNPDRAAAKLAALAHTRVAHGRMLEAAEAASSALTNSQAVNIQFLAARVFVETGDTDRALQLAAGLASALEAEPQAYAKIIEGNTALRAGDARQAISLLTEANNLLDTWIGRFDLGRAYLEAGALAQADSQFDQCLTRRGEALSLFLDEEPTYSYFPPVYYYQGLVREGLRSAGFAESYQQYLDIRGDSTEDPLLPEVRRRAGL